MSSELKYEDYKVAWICALPFEATAAMFMLDELHDGEFPWRSGQESIYTAGSLNGHNVVIACLPKGEYAVGAAARVVGQLRLCFPNLAFGLMVGIGAGVPGPEYDIRLGDVVVATPENSSGGCVGYDFGKETVDGFELKGWLNATDPVLRSAIANVESRAGHHGDVFVQYLEVFRNDPRGRKFLHPGLDTDLLYHSIRTNELVERPVRDHQDPVVHYGLIASGSKVIKNAILRDKLRDRHNIICLEMEASGLMNTLPVAIIRGVSDYADSHKNDKWQPYAAATAAAYAKGLLKVIRPGSVSNIKTDASLDIPSLNQLPEHAFILPYTQNPHFVGRRDIFERLQKELVITGEHQPRAVLWGLGGIGKSQIAIEFAYWHRKTYSECSVFWIHASSFDRFHQGFSEIAREYKVPGFDDPKANYLALMKTWLMNKRNGKWLMIIDNADESDVFFGKDTTIAAGALKVVPLNKYVPECSHGAILVTTRTKIVGQKFAKGRCLIKVSPMNKEESMELFCKQLQDESLKTDKLDELTIELEGLPLALAQAAAFIQMNSLTVHSYLKLYKETDDMKMRLLNEPFEAPGRGSEVPNQVTATWMISFEHIKYTAPHSANILSLMALLDRQVIPESLIESQVPDRMEFVKAIGTLRAFSLISVNEEDGTFGMHRLVHLAMRNWLRLTGNFDIWAISCVKIMSEKFPSGEYGTLDKCDLYTPHAKAALSYEQPPSANDVYRARLAYRVSRYLENRGSYDISSTLAEQACELYERMHGKEHPDTLRSMNNLAVMLHRQGKYSKAEEKLRQTLELREKFLGKEHSETLKSMADLATVLQSQGNYSETEDMNRRALELYENMLGKKHPHTLIVMGNLAGVLCTLGKYDEAEHMSRQEQELIERVLGRKHPETLTSMRKLAHILGNQGKYNAAENLLQQTLELSERVLGKEHPGTLVSMRNLAQILERKGMYNAAQNLHQQTLELSERVLGKEHPNTLVSMRSLAQILERKGMYNAAENLHQQTLELSEKVLGKKHPDTLASMHNLAMVLNRLGRYNEAEDILKQTIQIEEKLLGKEHPDTLATMSSLAEALHMQGKYNEAEKMNRQTLNLYKKVLGKEHPHTLMSMNNLATVLARKGNYDEAEEVYQHTLELREQVLGKEHPDTLGSLYCLALLLQRRKQYDNSSLLFQRALSGYREKLGLDHHTTLACSEDYSLLLEEMK